MRNNMHVVHTPNIARRMQGTLSAIQTKLKKKVINETFP